MLVINPGVQQILGEPVRFGETIQLQHVLSRKFITIERHETAQLEKENLQVNGQHFHWCLDRLKPMVRVSVDVV
jgi:hypothetical protein